MANPAAIAGSAGDRMARGAKSALAFLLPRALLKYSRVGEDKLRGVSDASGKQPLVSLLKVCL